MKGLKRIKMSLLVVIVLFCTVTTELVIQATTEQTFPYESAEQYVADCMMYGIIGEDGVPVQDSTQIVSQAILYDYTYKLLAEAVIDDTSLIVNSVLWQNVEKTLDGEIWGELFNLTNWQETIYQILLMDYLTYTGESTEYNNYIIETTAKYEFKVYKDLIKYADQIYGEEVDQMIEEMSLSDAIEFSEQYGYINELSKYTKLVGDITKVSNSAKEYYDNLTKAMAVQEINQNRINFLKGIQEQSSEDPYLYDAIDNIISLQEASYGELCFNEGAKIMINYGIEAVWDGVIDIVSKNAPNLGESLIAIKLGRAGLDWMFNSDETSENNIKLIFLYVINSKATMALQSIRNNYEENNSVENATALINAFSNYINYQKYASDCADSFVSEILFGGWSNSIGGILGNENEMTYEEFKQYFASDRSYCDASERMIRQYYKLYNAYAGNEEVPFSDIPGLYDASTGELKYTWDELISLEKITVENDRITDSDNLYGGLVIPSTVTGIGREAFESADITSVVIPPTIKSIPYRAFYRCYKLKKVEMSENIVTIGEEAFASCEALKDIELSENLTNLGRMAFARCLILSTIVIPEHVETIGYGCFSNCAELSEIYVDFNNDILDSRENCNAIIESDTNVLIVGCKNTIIPDGIVSIGKAAFYDCNNLVSINIPDGITRIENSAFFSCESLSNVVIPESVEEIGSGAFDYCRSITSLKLPSNLTKINSWTFDNCSGLKSITIPEKVTDIDDGAFSFCDNLEEVKLPDGLERIGDCTFAYCKKLNNIEIPSSILSIGEGAFSKSYELKNITFAGRAPASIGKNCFEGITMSAYYPSNDITWTSDIMQNYGGTITWIPLEEANNIEVLINNIGSTNSNATIVAPTEGWKEGENTFVVSCDNVCAVIVSNDNGKTYERLIASETNDGYSFTADGMTADTIITIMVLGDINGDGKLSTADVTKLKAASLQKVNLDTATLIAADVNGDGEITTADITKLKEVIVQKTVF